MCIPWFTTIWIFIYCKTEDHKWNLLQTATIPQQMCYFSELYTHWRWDECITINEKGNTRALSESNQVFQLAKIKVDRCLGLWRSVLVDFQERNILKHVWNHPLQANAEVSSHNNIHPHMAPVMIKMLSVKLWGAYSSTKLVWILHHLIITCLDNWRRLYAVEVSCAVTMKQVV